MTGPTDAHVVTADRIVDGRAAAAPDDRAGAWLVVVDGTVDRRGTGSVPSEFAALPVQHVAGTLVPGFVDVHAHGALGVDFARCSTEDARRAVGHHRANGTTTLVASIATGTLAATLAAIGQLAPLVADGTLAGLHLEGPYLSPARRGAHAPELLRTPDVDEVRRMLAAGHPGAVRMVTIAPELPGAIAVVEHLVAEGVTVAIGHTDADTTTTMRAIDAGATVATHLFNGMPPLHHRHPGPVGVVLADPRVTVELIVDGHHLDPTVVDLVRAAAPGRFALVSDAMAATGCADGAYEIAGSDVVVADGVAMLADGSSLAGSTITIADAVQRLATDAMPDELVAASSATAARALGLRTGLSVGSPADAVVLDSHLCPSGTVMKGGRWLPSS
ncbi:N-acetylglucosamine-6-phosphate deacetylase [Curtobacterium sp. RRHDQ10]|uniref:N-acetylglucosamine-6-phosphate deacetylase n=1 Tax=Curtobacterium phyllosphaerae TaxID=3413379 RepID=UPI003BF14903